jgi:4-diphosphocytidyl-2-C-methyl-D-erythritol kinase
VIVPAAFGVSTADAYRWWDEHPQTGPDPGAVIAAVESGNDEVLGPSLFNDLQAAVFSRHPELDEMIGRLLDAGALGAVMTGSGPTIVALARHMPHADQIAANVPGAFVAAGPPRPLRPI